MGSRDGSRRRVLSQDERVLWGSVTRSIAPLRAGAEPEPEAEMADATRPAPAKRAPAPEPAKPAPPPLVPLGRRLRTQVARGKQAIDARLDLHGLTQAQAHSALLHFLRTAGARGARLVLVITGKGARGDGEPVCCLSVCCLSACCLSACCLSACCLSACCPRGLLEAARVKMVHASQRDL